MEVRHIDKRHNKTCLLYHIVCPAKYRKAVFTKGVEASLKGVCKGISDRYEIGILELGVDSDHVHFLVQGVPSEPVSKIVQTIKGITSRELRRRHPEIKKHLWGGNLWTSGYYANTVGLAGNVTQIREYVEKQGLVYRKIYREEGQLTLNISIRGGDTSDF